MHDDVGGGDDGDDGDDDGGGGDDGDDCDDGDDDEGGGDDGGKQEEGRSKVRIMMMIINRKTFVCRCYEVRLAGTYVGCLAGNRD